MIKLTMIIIFDLMTSDYLAMCIIVVLYVGMGLFGYLRYGDSVLGSITLNLPNNEM